MCFSSGCYYGFTATQFLPNVGIILKPRHSGINDIGIHGVIAL